MTQAVTVGSDLDLYTLNRDLDRTKSQVFMGKNAAFLGSLMCALNFIWDENLDPPTAAASGTTIYWHPGFFNELCPETRETVLMHELWHVALLHLVRMGDRDPMNWNYACDIAINNMLEIEGYSFKGVEWCWKDQAYGTMSAEEIYDDLMLNKPPPPPMGSWGKPGNGSGLPGDMLPGTAAEKQQTVNAVVQSVTAATMAQEAGSIPGEIIQTINHFLAPVIPWEAVLFKFFNDMFETDFDWKVRDRRFADVYMPGESETDGKLEHLMYFLDVSGSITDAQVVRFNSEVKHIKDTFNPEKLTLAQFDTRITETRVFTEDDHFDEIVVVGRGGTSLVPVRAMIEETRPTAVVIFSDLHCPPMLPLTHPTPIIWVVISNKKAKVPFGDQIIHIKA